MKKNCTYNVTKVSRHLDGDKVKMLGLTPIYRNIPTIEEAVLLQKYAYIKRDDSSDYAIIPNDIDITNMGRDKKLIDDLVEKYKSKIEVNHISADTRKEDLYKVIRIIENDIIHTAFSELSLDSAKHISKSIYPAKDYIAVVPNNLDINDDSIMRYLIDRMSKGKGQHFVFEKV